MAEPPRPFHADDLFYRQIPQEFINLRKGRISAAAFQNSTGSNEMSVDWALLTTAAQTMARRPDRGVSQFTKQICDDLGQICRYDPVPDSGAHCGIVGDKPESVRAAFARSARFVLWPEGFIVPDSLIVGSASARVEGAGQ